jgi:hypothetical protein
MHYIYTISYIIIVAAVVAVHFAFMVYLIVGGFLALRRPRTIWLHLAAVAWGVGSLSLHLLCPLTEIELRARPRAGMSPLTSTGFIDHYFTGVLYPAADKGIAEVVVFTAVVVSWALFLAVGLRRRSSLRP